MDMYQANNQQTINKHTRKHSIMVVIQRIIYIQALLLLAGLGRLHEVVCAVIVTISEGPS